MDKASDFESEDCEFESRRGRYNFAYFILKMPIETARNNSKCKNIFLTEWPAKNIRFDPDVI